MPSQSSSARASSTESDRVTVGQLGDQLRQLRRRAGAALGARARSVPLVGVEEVRRGDVERVGDVVARPQARALDGDVEQLERRGVRVERRAEAALVGLQRRSGRARAARRPSPRTRRRPSRSASRYVAAPTGMTRKSWKSSWRPACRPPLMMFTIGSGSSGSVAREMAPERDARDARPRRARTRARRRGSRWRRGATCPACRRARRAARSTAREVGVVPARARRRSRR